MGSRMVMSYLDGGFRNRGALFVIPSQFNAAEYPYHTDLLFQVEDYKHENGSGPRAQLAVHPAVAQFILDNAAGFNQSWFNVMDDFGCLHFLLNSIHFLLGGTFCRIFL